MKTLVKILSCLSHHLPYVPPVVWPVWTPVAWLAGFIIRGLLNFSTTKVIKAVGLVVSLEQSLICFYCKLLGANQPQGIAIF